jgi:(R,R)-butanediol dehydrogenase/meso-butanediol dehydrogenase/diacetyl reductase
MKALRFYGHRDVRLEEIVEPTLRRGWSLVDVEWASICGSDVKEYLGPAYLTNQINPVTGNSLPVTLGHEFAGRVLTNDGTRSDIAIGDAVAVEASVRDGECWYCRQGNYILCDKLAMLGFDFDGAFAERVLVPTYSLQKLPTNVSTQEGALIEPLAVAVHAIRRGGVRAGDVVAIVGAGMMGLSVAAVAQASGASAVHVVDRSPRRRARALALGVTSAIDPSDGDSEARLVALTSGQRAHVAFDCVGAGQSASTAINLARKGGRVVVVGIFKSEPTVDLNKVVLQERELIGSFAYVDDFPRAMSLVSDGRIKADDFISDRIPLSDIVRDGFERLAAEPDNFVRIVVDVHH